MKLFLTGAGPLPGDTDGMIHAGGLRTAHFLNIIQNGEAGENVANFVSIFVVENDEYQGIKLVKENRHLRHTSVSRHDPKLYRYLREEYNKTTPDVVIGVNTFPAYLAAQVVKAGVPFWADLNGWVLAELQAQSFAMDSNAFITHGRKMEKTILKRADKISVVSMPQKFAVYGELAMLDRTLKDNFATPLVEVVENSCRPLTKAEKEDGEILYRGKLVPQDAVMICWLGGFNAWADEKTLFTALEKAMITDHKINFLATGGVLKGIDETSFVKFTERVNTSAVKKQFHLLGWVTPPEVTALLKESDIGLNVDRLCLETETGARNRLNEMLRFHLPIVTTRGTEIASVLEEGEAALTAASGDANALAEVLVRLSGDKILRNALSKRAEVLINSRFCETITGRHLQAWLKHPICAPDYGKRDSSAKSGRFGTALLYLRQRGARATFAKLRQVVTQKIG